MARLPVGTYATFIPCSYVTEVPKPAVPRSVASSLAIRTTCAFAASRPEGLPFFIHEGAAVCRVKEGAPGRSMPRTNQAEMTQALHKYSGRVSIFEQTSAAYAQRLRLKGALSRRVWQCQSPISS